MKLNSLETSNALTKLNESPKATTIFDRVPFKVLSRMQFAMAGPRHTANPRSLVGEESSEA